MRRVMAVAARYPAARETQFSRVGEVQKRLAAALALPALILTYRAWSSKG